MLINNDNTIRTTKRRKLSLTRSCIMLLLATVITGCTLENAPQCMVDEVKCMASSEGTGQVVKVCGSKSGNWQNVISCDNAGCNSEKTACKTTPSCSEEDNMCEMATAYNFSVAFRCSNNAVIPVICNGMCDGKTKNCYDAFSGVCEKDAEFCVVGPNGIAMEFSCSDSGVWSSKYCLSGCDAAGKKCGSDSGCTSNGKVSCCDANEITHLKVVEDNADSCSYECKDGFLDCDEDDSVCEIQQSLAHKTTCHECSEGYLDCDEDNRVCEVDKKESHMTACDACENDYGNCDEDWANGCEAQLSQLHLDACKECSFGYGNCDEDWSNGCEMHLESRHLVSCGECEYGYGNCDGRIENGCEIEFNPRNLESCEVCNLGYGNCDGDWANGCEIEFNPRNLAACKECNMGYGNCDGDWANGCEIQLSLHHLSGCNQCLDGWDNCDNDWSNGCETDLTSLNKKSCSECKDGFTLKDGSCVPKNCTQGEHKCWTDADGTTAVRKCNNNDWVIESTCSNSCAGNACGECINGKTKCTNEGTLGKVQTCDGGKWGTAKNCSGNYSCNSTKTACGKCVNGTMKCTLTDLHLPDTLSTCENGAYVQRACPSPSSDSKYLGGCKDATSCVDSVQFSCAGRYCFKCAENYCKHEVYYDTYDCASDILTNSSSCGVHCLSCTNELPSIPSNANRACVDGYCAWRCKSGYHGRYSYGTGADSDNYCEKDDLDNCSWHGRSCRTDAGTTECKSAKCQYNSCNSGYK